MKFSEMNILESEIRLPAMRFYAYHGVDPQERVVGAEYRVSLQVAADFTRALQSDELEDTVNYADLYACVKREMETPSLLLEHVAGRIVRAVFDAFPRIRRITLELYKQNPPLGADCKEAGVRLVVGREEPEGETDL